nr:exportin-4-like [Leptinotarsa decemlineata]
MTEQIVVELENAARVLMAPPNVVSNEQRHSAETIFLDFRRSKSPYGICREILEKSENQYVMFEAAEVLRGAIIREWAFLLDSDKSSLRQYLLQYVTTKELPSFVRERILQVIAIMVKRASIDDSGRERSSILQEVENLIVNAEPNKKILGCNIISNLMQEYATTIKSTDVGLPWEVHFKAKKQFEATDLKRIFQFCVYLLSEVVKNDPPYSPEFIDLVGHLLKITEKVLTWGYVSPILPKRLIGIYESVFESDAAPSLKLTESWSEIILNPELLPLMFQIYWKVRDSDHLAHHSMACLVQFATLSGGVIASDESRKEYLNSYLMSFLKLLLNIKIKSKESLGISNIVKKLVIFFIHDITKLQPSLQDTLLDEFTRLTCHFCEEATLEENSEEDKFFSEAFDNMLEAWPPLIQEYSLSRGDKFPVCSQRIISMYIECHLAPPVGTRQVSSCDQDEIEDNEDNDRIRYRDQLQVIGMFGRVVPHHTLPVLFRLLEARIDKLVEQIQVMQSRAMTISEAVALDGLFEDIHWIILIAGHVLCMDSDGETPMIPSEIMHHSLEQHICHKAGLEASLKCIAAIESKVAKPENFEQSDHVIRIVFDIMKLCTIEDFAASVNLAQFMSPEVGSSIMWFLKRWCLSYLLPVDLYYQELSPTLIGCLGKDTEGAKLLVSSVLSKIRSNIYHFKSEPILLRDTVDLFCDICVKYKSNPLVDTASMRNLINLFQELEPGCLPPNILRGLCKGFVLAGAALQSARDPDSLHTMNRYLEMILTPIQQKFKNLLEHGDFTRISGQERVQKTVIDLLECLIGVAKGSLMPSTISLFQFLAPILSELHILLTIYSSYQVIVHLILELFGQCAKYMLCYLSPLDSQRLYESALATVQAYAKCNAGRFTAEKFAEESSCQDLALVLDLLTFILSKDCIDLCTETNHTETNITASDVSLFGLNFIMPLMTLDLLKYPSLCAQYYRLLVLINDIYPEKICNLPSDLLQTLLKSIELGLTNFGPDIVQACLDFIQGMATYIFKHNMLNTPFYQALRPFLKLLMDLTLTHQINSDSMIYASTALYVLICCYQEDYKLLVQSLIQMQTDPMIGERLAAAFNNLVNNIDMTCDRLPKLKFRDNFDRFIANVHGFLLVK